MSLFGKLFASKKEQPTLSTQDALQKLQETEDMLLKKNDFLELKVKQVWFFFYYLKVNKKLLIVLGIGNG